MGYYEQTFNPKELEGSCTYPIKAGALNLEGKEYRNFRTVEWCIWIDYIAENYVYKQIKLTEKEETLYFQGIYFITIAICRKRHYFIHDEDYDMFALEFATDIYNRYFHKGQYKEDNPLTPIRSVKNYVAQILYGRKVGYEQKEYAQVDYIPETLGELIGLSDPDSIGNNSLVKESIKEIADIDRQMYLKNISETLEIFLKTTPYNSNPVDIRNISISIYLTLASWQTEYLDKQKELEPLTNKSIEYSAVLYHLNPSMNAYIVLLSREFLKKVLIDLEDLSKTDSIYMTKNTWNFEQLKRIGRANEINGDFK